MKHHTHAHTQQAHTHVVRASSACLSGTPLTLTLLQRFRPRTGLSVERPSTLSKDTYYAEDATSSVRIQRVRGCVITTPPALTVRQQQCSVFYDVTLAGEVRASYNNSRTPHGVDCVVSLAYKCGLYYYYYDRRDARANCIAKNTRTHPSPVERPSREV